MTGIFSLYGEAAHSYLSAMNTAANYAADIDSVIDVQVEAGIASPVATLRPVMTFKG